MARQDNPFALLVDDDEGGDVETLARVEAKISTTPSPAAAEKQKQQKGAVDRLPSNPPPAEEYARGDSGVRGRGRGVRGRGLGRGGFGPGGRGSGNDGDEEKFGNLYLRGSAGNHGGRGRGSDRGGGRGRGRGRGSYEGRGFGSGELFNGGDGNQGGNIKDSEEGSKVQGESNALDEARQFRYENKTIRGEGRDPWREARGYGGDNHGVGGGDGHEGRGYGGENRGYGGIEGREGRGYGGENRGFRSSEDREGSRGYGGDNRDFRGGYRRRYVGNDGTQSVTSEGWNGSENKEDAAVGKQQGGYNVSNKDGSGWEMPETTEVPKAAVAEQTNPEQVVVSEKPPEDEDNQMTLDEYEKLFHEKRKALEGLKTEERKVIVDKEFKGMQLVDKKKEDGLFIKLKFEKDKLKKKDSLEKEEKARKSVSINEFLKPAEGEKYVGPPSSRGRGRGRGERGGGGGFRGGFAGRADHAAAAPRIEDPGQFPLLGGDARARFC